MRNSAFEKLVDHIEISVENDYAASIGKIVLYWNAIHSTFFVWFETLSEISYEDAKNIWEKFQSDSSQRNMLRCLQEKMDDKKKKSDFLWLISQIDNLSPYRNAIVHTNVSFDNQSMKMQPDEYSSKKSHIKKILEIGNEIDIIKLQMNITHLASFSLDMLLNFWDSEKNPWPNRPSLYPLPYKENNP